MDLYADLPSAKKDDGSSVWNSQAVDSVAEEQKQQMADSESAAAAAAAAAAPANVSHRRIAAYPPPLCIKRKGEVPGLLRLAMRAASRAIAQALPPPISSSRSFLSA